MKKLFLTLCIALATLMPQIAAAQLDIQPSAQEGAAACASQGYCTTCHFIELIDNVIQTITITLMPGLTLLMIVVGAVYITFSGGSQSLIKKGQTIIVLAIGAQIAALSAFFVVNFVLASVLGADFNNVQIFGGENNIFAQNTWYDYCTNQQLSAYELPPVTQCTEDTVGRLCDGGEGICHSDEICLNPCQAVQYDNTDSSITYACLSNSECTGVSGSATTYSCGEDSGQICCAF